MRRRRGRRPITSFPESGASGGDREGRTGGLHLRRWQTDFLELTPSEEPPPPCAALDGTALERAPLGYAGQSGLHLPAPPGGQGRERACSESAASLSSNPPFVLTIGI